MWHPIQPGLCGLRTGGTASRGIYGCTEASFEKSVKLRNEQEVHKQKVQGEEEGKGRMWRPSGTVEGGEAGMLSHLYQGLLSLTPTSEPLGSGPHPHSSRWPLGFCKWKRVGVCSPQGETTSTHLPDLEESQQAWEGGQEQEVGMVSSTTEETQGLEAQPRRAFVWGAES